MLQVRLGGLDEVPFVLGEGGERLVLVEGVERSLQHRGLLARRGVRLRSELEQLLLDARAAPPGATPNAAPPPSTPGGCTGLWLQS